MLDNIYIIISTILVLSMLVFLSYRGSKLNCEGYNVTFKIANISFNINNKGVH